VELDEAAGTTAPWAVFHSRQVSALAELAGDEVPHVVVLVANVYFF
jgi:hypothetical protein